MSYKPDGVQNLIPSLVFKNSRDAVAFYEAALGVTDVDIMEGEDGKIVHGHFKIGDTTVFFNDEMDMFPRKAPDNSNVAVSFYVYVKDVDAVHKTCVLTGMTSVYEPQTMFWGDRTSVLTDPYHYTWTLSSKVSEPSAEEMDAGRKAMFGGDT